MRRQRTAVQGSSHDPARGGRGGRATVYLGLGANLGAREEALAEAVRRLERAGLEEVVGSAVYETEAVTPQPQPDYLNAVVRARTALGPQSLLAECLAIEKALGRVRPPGERHAPRTIDIDLLLWDDLVLQTPDLELPHPRLLERAFVRVPLADVAAPDLRHPVTRESLTEIPALPGPPPRRAGKLRRS